jgi:hypothetical protein
MTALDEATGIALRTVRGFLRGRARRDGIVDDRSGALVIIQRFGGALNLNVHLHALVLDVVCAMEGSGVAFIPCGDSRATTWRMSWRGSSGSRSLHSGPYSRSRRAHPFRGRVDRCVRFPHTASRPVLAHVTA